MQKLEELLDQKRHLNYVKRMLDSEASFQTWEGWAYTRCLTELVLVELELEAIEKEKAAH